MRWPVPKQICRTVMLLTTPAGRWNEIKVTHQIHQYELR